jgi:hypothetical protein
MADAPGYRAGKRLWTAEDDERMRREYPDTPTAVLARSLGRSCTAVSARADKLGLHKSAAYLASPAACRLRRGDNVGAPYRFTKGQAPANKGLRRPGWHRGRMQETQFKKGTLNGFAKRRMMPVGSTRLCDGYVYRKVAETPAVPWTQNWMPEHRLVWEREHGPVPAGHALAFRDGNRLNTAIENLVLIPRTELMRRNSMHTNLPKPLVQTIQLLGALRRRIRRMDDGAQQDR